MDREGCNLVQDFDVNLCVLQSITLSLQGGTENRNIITHFEINTPPLQVCCKNQMNGLHSGESRISLGKKKSNNLFNSDNL